MKSFASNLLTKIFKRKKYVIANRTTHAFDKGKKYEVLHVYPHGITVIKNKYGERDAWFSEYFK